MLGPKGGQQTEETEPPLELPMDPPKLSGAVCLIIFL